MKRLLFVLLALPACADDDLEALWKDACLWEVGSNAEKVPAARKRLVEHGAAALDFIIPAKLDTADGLVARALQTVVPGIAQNPEFRGKAVEMLTAALASENPNVRRNAADLLGHVGAVETAPAIAKLLHDKDARGGALSALGALRAESSVPAIAELLGAADSTERLRLTCVATLGAIGGPAALEALVTTLTDSASQIRFAAQYSLESLRAVGTLATLLRNSDKRVRLHALSALGRLADRSVRPDVRPLADDADPVVRGFALEALSAMSKPSDEAWLRARLASERDPFARGKLLDALRRFER